MSHDTLEAPAASPAGIRIDPEAWYTDAMVRLVLGLPGATLQRARRAGELRHTRRGGRTWHRGEWVIDWLSGRERSEALAHVA